jgi:hypothetical protein
MRSRYLESLAEGGYIASLMTMAIRELGIKAEHPVDLNTLPYENFELDDIENESKKIQANTAYVFSQALTYASSILRYTTRPFNLTYRNEWSAMRDRVLQERVQAFVAKYMSAKLIAKELSTIKEATSTPEFSQDNVEITVNEITREIVTRYQVDEGQKTEMIIRLPASYPLAEVEIIGTNRVAVREERWNKWLLTCKIGCKVSWLSRTYV